MKMQKQNKRAEMTSTQIVTLVLLIAGFAIILYVFYQVGFTKEIDREVCHESVILRMTLPDTIFLDLKNLPSLRCKTKKICITDNLIGKGDCEELGKDYETIKISKDENEREKQINAFIAQELADCWSMMGEGKGQIFTRDISTKSRCSVCSRIAFDIELKKELKEVRGMGTYLISHKVPNTDITYWDFLSSGDEKYKSELGDSQFSTTQKSIIFIEVSNSAWTQFLGVIGVGSSGAALGTFVGFISGGPVGAVFGAVIGGTAGGIGGDLIGEEFEGEKFYSGIIFGDYSSEEFKKMDCSSLENIP